MKFHLVARRDLAAYLNGYYGFVIIAVLLLVEGVVFNAYVLGSGAQ